MSSLGAVPREDVLGGGHTATEADMSLPTGWRRLPLVGLELDDLEASLQQRGALEVAQMVADLAGTARDEGIRLVAVGALDAGPGCPEIPAAVTLAVRAATTDVALDRTAEALGTDQVGLRNLRWAGPSGYLAWSRPVGDEQPRLIAHVVQHWVPFPEDERIAVLTAAAVAPDGTRPGGSLEGLGDGLAFVDPDGRIVIPRP